MPARPHLIATGGTIDKIYNPLTGQLDVGPPVLPGILAAAGLTADDLVVNGVLRKDSLEITDDERTRLAPPVQAERPGPAFLPPPARPPRPLLPPPEPAAAGPAAGGEGAP